MNQMKQNNLKYNSAAKYCSMVHACRKRHYILILLEVEADFYPKPHGQFLSSGPQSTPFSLRRTSQKKIYQLFFFASESWHAKYAKLQVSTNKATGYHRDIFCPPTFAKSIYRKLEAFFSDEYSYFWKSSNFSNFTHFLFFFCKKITLGGKRTFLNNIILYEFYTKFAAFTDFEKKIIF